MPRKKAPPPQAEKPSPVSTRKRAPARKPPSTIIDHAKLQELRDAGKKQWMLAPNTSTTYKGHVDRGRRFLSQLVTSKRASGIENLDGLDSALDDIPNKHSAYVLELFLTEKCFNQGLTYQTSEGIYSAFMKLWDQR